MNNIENMWENYRLTLPKSSSVIQIVEARLGFFSGATAIYSLMMAKALDEDITEEQGEEFLKSLAEEINGFIEDVLTKDHEFFAKGATNES